MFLDYDLLAKRWVPYAYLYPFAEGLAGVLMIRERTRALTRRRPRLQNAISPVATSPLAAELPAQAHGGGFVRRV